MDRLINSRGVPERSMKCTDHIAEPIELLHACEEFANGLTSAKRAQTYLNGTKLPQGANAELKTLHRRGLMDSNGKLIATKDVCNHLTFSCDQAKMLLVDPWNPAPDRVKIRAGAWGAGPKAVKVWPHPKPPSRLVVMDFKKLVVEVGASSGESQYQRCQLADGSHTLPDPKEWVNTQGGNHSELNKSHVLIKTQWQAYGSLVSMRGVTARKGRRKTRRKCKEEEECNRGLRLGLGKSSRFSGRRLLVQDSLPLWVELLHTTHVQMRPRPT